MRMLVFHARALGFRFVHWDFFFPTKKNIARCRGRVAEVGRLEQRDAGDRRGAGEVE